MRRRPPVRQLTIAQQYLALQAGAVSAGRGSLRHGKLVWEFITKPSPISREYRIRIVYQSDHPPQVFVVEPDIKALAGERQLPHVYEQRPTRLCLYLPGSGEWSPVLKLSETIVPWAVLWLYYFEHWLATDEWLGGGKHPEANREKHKKNSLH